LKRSIADLYEYLRKMRNTAAHAIEAEISTEEANRYIYLTFGLAENILASVRGLKNE